MYIGCLTPVIVIAILVVMAEINRPTKEYTEVDVVSLSDSLSITKDSAERILVYQQHRATMIKQSFTYDGMHLGLRRTVISQLKDPDSFEHISTQYSDKNDYLMVLMKYRAKNSFGGFVVNSVKAKVSLDGSQVVIVE